MTASTVTQALSHYEAALRTVDAPVADWLYPGATSTEIDEAEQRAGFPFPEDVRAVWSWHNGSAPPASDRMNYLTPGSWFADISTAVDTRFVALLVPFGYPGLMVIDCATPDAPDAPAVRLGREDRYTDVSKSFSVTATIELWTSWVLEGWWTLDEHRQWTFDLQGTPAGPERFQF